MVPTHDARLQFRGWVMVANLAGPRIAAVLSTRRHKTRLFEWMTSAMMLGMSFVIAASPQSVHMSGLSLMMILGVTPLVLGVSFFLIALVRMTALIVNGMSFTVGPHARSIASLFGAMIWVQMAFATWEWSTNHGYVAVSVPVYAALTVGEIISCYRAATDVRHKPGP